MRGLPGRSVEKSLSTKCRLPLQTHHRMGKVARPVIGLSLVGAIIIDDKYLNSARLSTLQSDPVEQCPSLQPQRSEKPVCLLYEERELVRKLKASGMFSFFSGTYIDVAHLVGMLMSPS